MKKFYLPVAWMMWDKIEVVAENIEDAIQYLKDNIDELPLGTDPEYLEGTHHLMDGADGENDMNGAIKYLRDNWNFSGGITGEELDTSFDFNGNATTNDEDDWER